MDILQISLGIHHTCFIAAKVPEEGRTRKKEGDVYCIGRNNQGQRGLLPSNVSLNPQDPNRVNLGVYLKDGDQKFYEAKQLVSNKFSTCALLANKEDERSSGHRVKCWGRNDSGQLGLGRIGNSEPEFVYENPSIRSISGVRDGYCVLNTSHDIQCWGNTLHGRLGHEDQIVGFKSELEDRLDPLYDVPFTNLNRYGTNLKQISAFSNSTCVLYEDGKSNCFGSNSNFRLATTVGNGENPNTVTEESKRRNPPNLTMKSMVLGHTNSCAIMSNDRVYCAGSGTTGINGDENTSSIKSTFPDEPIEAFKDKVAPETLCR